MKKLGLKENTYNEGKIEKLQALNYIFELKYLSQGEYKRITY